MSFAFNPPTGLLDVATFPTTPANETAGRQQFMTLFNQIRDEMNSGANSAIATNNLYRQAITNGNFDIWQRGTNFTVGTRSLYTADRWIAFRSGLVTGLSVSRQDGTGLTGSKYCARIQRIAGDSSAENMSFIQAMESVDSVKFRGKYLTISFWARTGLNFSPTSSRIIVAPVSGTGTDESPVSLATGQVDIGSVYVNLSSSWTKYTVTTNQVVPSNANQLFFKFVAEPLGVAGANDYFEIAQVQVNSGNVALPLQPRSVSEEDALCKRYFEKSYNVADAPGAITSFGIFGHQAVVANVAFTIPFKVSKRVTPTVTFYSSSTGASGKFRDFSASADVSAAVGGNGESQCTVNVTGAVAGNLIVGHWTSDAEL